MGYLQMKMIFTHISIWIKKQPRNSYLMQLLMKTAWKNKILKGLLMNTEIVETNWMINQAINTKTELESSLLSLKCKVKK